MLIEATLRARGVRDAVDLSLYTPEARPMAVAGEAVGDALMAMMAGKGIAYHPTHPVTEVGPEALRFGDLDVPYDLVVGVPPHRAPDFVAGLVDSTGYIPVHPQTLEILSDVDTLETRFPGVYAIGDVASIRLLNSMLLPKAGVFAEAEAQVVAARIAADILGEPTPAGFKGDGFCYVEVGDGMAAYGSGDFYAYPAPRVRLEDPTASAKAAKFEYERLLEAWFE